MKFTSIIASALLSTTALADLTCKALTYGDSADNTGNVQFLGNYLSVGNLKPKNLHIAQSNTQPVFRLRECTSKSFNLSACVNQGTTNDHATNFAGAYFTNVQVVDDITGLCMSRALDNSGRINFRPCDPSPQTTNQIWRFYQYFSSPNIYAPSIYTFDGAAWKELGNPAQRIALGDGVSPLPQIKTLNATGLVPYSVTYAQTC